MQGDGFQSLEIIETGHFYLDGGAMFGVVPKVLWEKIFPPNAQNQIILAARIVLLTRSDGTQILIDSGVGADGSETFNKNFNVKTKKLSDFKNITQLTHLLATHLHFDHVGGAQNCLEFQKAADLKVWISKANLETAINPNRREKASYLKERFEQFLIQNKFIELNVPQGEFLDLEQDLKVFRSDGHTLGLLVPHFYFKGQSYIYAADLIPTHAHVSLAWGMSYDLRPLDVITEKQFLLEQAVKNNSIIIFEHDPLYSMARIEKIDKKGFVDFKPIFL